MKKQWEKDIRDQLKDFSKKAPEGLLYDIKEEMIRRGLSSAPVTGRTHHIPFIRIVSATTAIILLLLGISHLWQEPSVLPIIPKHTDSLQTVPLLPVVTETKVPKGLPVSNVSNLIAKVDKTKPVPSYAEKPLKEEEHSPETISEDAKEKKDKEQAEHPKERDEQDIKETAKDNVLPISKTKWLYNVSRRKKSSFSLGVYYSGVIAQADSKNEAYNLNSSPSGSGQHPDTTNVSQSRCAPAIYNLTGRPTHHIPVKLGVSFRYDLNERWNLQSGLAYSYLASDISETTYNGVYDTKQKLHYIGIPLQIGYKIGKGKRFSSYIATGFQVEKLVSGKADVRHSKEGKLQCSYVQNVSDKRLLYSALASFGVEYDLGKKFSLYAEPGFHYYFKNGNNLQTHYNEKPLNLNLTIGFRFHHKTK